MENKDEYKSNNKVKNKDINWAKRIIGSIIVVGILGFVVSFYFMPNKMYPLLFRFNEAFYITDLSLLLINYIRNIIYIDPIAMSIIIPITIDAILLSIFIGVLILIFNRKKAIKIVLNILLFILLTVVTVRNPPLDVYWPKITNTSISTAPETKEIIESDVEETLVFETVSIDIPAHFVDEKGSISVDEYKYPNKEIGYDIQLKDKNGESVHLLNGFVEIYLEIPDEDLNSIDYRFYDKDENEWRDVAWYYDIDLQKIVLLTNHFTEFKKIVRDKNEGLLKKIEPPIFEYSTSKGLYVKGARPITFDIENIKKSKTLQQAAVDIVNIVKGNQTYNGAVEVFKLVTAIEQIDNYKYEIDAVKNMVNPKNVKVDELRRYLETIDNNGYNITKGLKKFMTGLGLVDFLANSFLYYDEMSKGTDKGDGEAAYMAAKQTLSLVSVTYFGPYGFLVDPAVFITETGYKEFKFYEEDDTKTAYYTYYNSPKYSIPDSYWYNRFNQIVEEVGGIENIRLGVELLDTEINDYLTDFWLSENKTIREELGCWSVLNDEKREQMLKTYKVERDIYGLEKSILDRYIRLYEKSVREYQILMIKAYYEELLNHIVEIDVVANGYALEHSNVQVEVDGNVIWEGKFDNNSKCEFQSRYFYLIPKDVSSRQTITVWTNLVDKDGNKVQKQEEINIVDLGIKIQLEYNSDPSYGIKIKDQDIHVDQDESYRFEYEYEGNGGDIIIPDKVVWKTSSGSIDQNGWFTPGEVGDTVITVEAYYENNDVMVSDSVIVEVEGEEVGMLCNFYVMDKNGNGILDYTIEIKELGIKETRSREGENAGALELMLPLKTNLTITATVDGVGSETQTFYFEESNQGTTAKTLKFTPQ